MDQQVMGKFDVKLGPVPFYNTFSKEGNTFTTFVKCFNERIMLQINNSKELKWNMNALIKN